MASNRLSYLAISAFSLFLFACPAPVDNQEGTADGSGGSSSGGSSGRGGSGSGGSPGGSTGGSSSSGGSTGGSSSSGGSTGGSSSSGGTSGSGGSGTGGSTGGSSGSGGSGTGGSTGGTSGTGGSTGGTGGSTGGTGGSTGGSGGMTDARAEAPAAMGTKVPANVQAVFMKCGTACHGGNWGDATKSYARLKMNAMGCGAMPRMTVSDGANSLVVKKLKGAVAGCGARMPLNMPALSEAEIMTVESWITMGAQPVP